MAKRNRKKETEDAEEILGPAKPHEGHVQHVLAGGRRGWKNIAEHPLTYAFQKGHLARGNPRYSEGDRLQAGTLYRALCETLSRSGRDCLDLELISRPTGFQISDAKAHAMHILARIDRGLKPCDRTIVRRVCGDGWWPNAAVRDACGHRFYEKVAVPRFVEALDELIEASRAARRPENREPARE